VIREKNISKRTTPKTDSRRTTYGQLCPELTEGSDPKCRTKRLICPASASYTIRIVCVAPGASPWLLNRAASGCPRYSTGRVKGLTSSFIWTLQPRSGIELSQVTLPELQVLNFWSDDFKKRVTVSRASFASPRMFCDPFQDWDVVARCAAQKAISITAGAKISGLDLTPANCVYAQRSVRFKWQLRWYSPLDLKRSPNAIRTIIIRSWIESTLLKEKKHGDVVYVQNRVSAPGGDLRSRI